MYLVSYTDLSHILFLDTMIVADDTLHVQISPDSVQGHLAKLFTSAPSFTQPRYSQSPLLGQPAWYASSESPRFGVALGICTRISHGSNCIGISG